jgi:hypothetical protein
MVKAFTITAHPKPEAGWVHRFRNFGEDVCDRLRGLCDMDIAAVDAAFDEFHVGDVREADIDAVARTVATLNRAHHLDDSVFFSIRDEPAYHQTVMVVLDTRFGERVWEIAGRHPIWVVGSEVNKAAVEQMRKAKEPGEMDVTLWSNEFELVTEQDWLGILDVVDMHHGEFASNPPMNKLSVYGVALSLSVAAALRSYGFEAVIATASGFIALREW